MLKRLLLGVVSIFLLQMSFGQTLGRPSLGPPKFTFQRGLNLTAGSPEYAGGDVTWLVKDGFDHVGLVINVEDGLPGIQSIAALARRCVSAGLGVEVRPFYAGTSITAFEAWWVQLASAFRSTTITSTPPLSPQAVQFLTLNNPGQRWGVNGKNEEQWRQAIQPAVYNIIRKVCPNNTIIFSAGMFDSYEGIMLYSREAGFGQMWLPPAASDRAKISIAWQAYVWDKFIGSQNTFDPTCADDVLALTRSLGVGLHVDEFNGGEGSTPWGSVCVPRIAAITQALASRGIGWAFWHWSGLSDLNQAVRPDVLAALMCPSYKPPLTGAHTTFGPAGSSPISVGPSQGVGSGTR